MCKTAWDELWVGGVRWAAGKKRKKKQKVTGEHVMSTTENWGRWKIITAPLTHWWGILNSGSQSVKEENKHKLHNNIYMFRYYKTKEGITNKQSRCFASVNLFICCAANTHTSFAYVSQKAFFCVCVCVLHHHDRKPCKYHISRRIQNLRNNKWKCAHMSAAFSDQSTEVLKQLAITQKCTSTALKGLLVGDGLKPWSQSETFCKGQGQEPRSGTVLKEWEKNKSSWETIRTYKTFQKKKFCTTSIWGKAFWARAVTKNLVITSSLWGAWTQFQKDQLQRQGQQTPCTS